MTSPRNITMPKFKEGVAKWRPLVIQALSGRNMTADKLIKQLLAENYGKIDEASLLIMLALNELFEVGRIRASGVTISPDSRIVETCLTSDLNTLY